MAQYPDILSLSMRILIFGATGGTGQHLVTQALAQNQVVTAFVRQPNRLSLEAKNLSIVQGNILDTKAVDKAVKGQEAVISVLGNKTSQVFWKPNTIISEGLKNIISAMEKNKVKRLLFVSSFGAGEKIFWPEKMFIKIVLKNIFSDVYIQENFIKKSGLDWTIVRPARLVNEPKIGIYRAGEDLPIGLFSRISRAAVADFLLKNLPASDSFGKILTISY